jgi:hypothetical protein
MKRGLSELRESEQTRVEADYHRMKPEQLDEVMTRARPFAATANSLCLTRLNDAPNVASRGFGMIYIQIPEKQDAKGFLILAKSGFPVVCLPENTYGVREQHIALLKRKRISFKKLDASKIPMPQSAFAV